MRCTWYRQVRVYLCVVHQVSVSVCGEPGECVCVLGAPGECTCVIVIELDVSVLLGGDGDGYRGVTQHSVDSAGRVCSTKLLLNSKTEGTYAPTILHNVSTNATLS